MGGQRDQEGRKDVDSLCDRKTEYVVGFLFSEDRERVVLIRKNRPDWQKGSLNGVGGHVNPGETYAEAMRREFLEEAGLDVPDWEEVATVECPNVRVVFFRAFGGFEGVKVGLNSVTDERIRLAFVGNLSIGGRIVLANQGIVWPTAWVIGMCLDDELVLPVPFSYKTDGNRRRG